jgi:branched-chain amino acid transport system substrate-binding protein
MKYSQGSGAFRNRLALFALLSVIMALVVFGSATSKGKEPFVEKTPIRVGVYLDLTGQTSSFGQATRDGIEMARDEINGAGGIDGREVELIVRDEAGEPQKVATVVEKLIKEDKVHALIGEVASTLSMYAAPIAQEAKVPMIAPSSTNPKVTQTGDYIFRVCFIDPYQGEAMAKFAINTLKAKRAAILFDPDSIYSKGLTDAFRRKYETLGGRVVSQQSYTQQDRYYITQLRAIRAAKPSVIYLSGYYPEVGVIVAEARRLGMNQPLLGGDGWDAPPLWTLGGKALNNSYISNHFAPDDPSPAVRRFITNYKNKYPETAHYSLAALGYDAMMILADAIKRAGTTDGEKLRDAIAKTRNFPGVTGSITIDSERNAVKPAIIFRLLDGKFVYHETIYPDNE